MDQEDDSLGPHGRKIDTAMKAAFVAALRGGTRCDDAAAALGLTPEAFDYRRRRDPLFRFAWKWALELSAADQREAMEAATFAAAAAEDAILPNNKRRLQRRRARGTEFTDVRKQRFLDHFAGTADVQASCQIAGIHYSTVYKHRRTDPVFGAGWDEALAQAYAFLEAEALRQRLAAQRRLAFEPLPSGEITHEFERVMKLLARYDRKDGRVAARTVGPGRQKSATFEEAIELLDKKLQMFGKRRALIAPGGEGSLSRDPRRDARDRDDPGARAARRASRHPEGNAAAHGARGRAGSEPSPFPAACPPAAGPPKTSTSPLTSLPRWTRCSPAPGWRGRNCSGSCWRI
jgi:hypothetical protein